MNLTIIRQILHYFRIVNYNHFVNPTHYEWNIYVQLICRLLTSRYYVFALRISSFQHERLFMQSCGSSTIAHRSCNLECLILEHDCDVI